MNWYVLALLSVVFFGVRNFLFKVAAERGCNSAFTTLYYLASATVLAGIAAAIIQPALANLELLAILAGLNAIFYAVSTTSKIEALNFLDGSIVYPLVRLSIVPVVIYSLVFLNESLSLYHGIGIILAIGTIFLLSKREDGTGIMDYQKGITFLVIAAFTTAGAAIVNKYASQSLNQIGYIAASYLFNMVFAFIIRNRLVDGGDTRRGALKIGVAIGAVDVVGFFLLIRALSTGPLSLVVPIQTLNIAVAVLLAVVVYKEEMNWRRGLGTILAIAAAVLLGV